MKLWLGCHCTQSTVPLRRGHFSDLQYMQCSLHYQLRKERISEAEKYYNDLSWAIYVDPCSDMDIPSHKRFVNIVSDKLSRYLLILLIFVCLLLSYIFILIFLKKLFGFYFRQYHSKSKLVCCIFVHCAYRGSKFPLFHTRILKTDVSSNKSQNKTKTSITKTKHNLYQCFTITVETIWDYAQCIL